MFGLFVGGYQEIRRAASLRLFPQKSQFDVGAFKFPHITVSIQSLGQIHGKRSKNANPLHGLQF